MCNHKKTKVIDSRKIREGVRRRYKCLSCGERWSTVEVIVDTSKCKNGFNSYDALKKEISLTPEQIKAIVNLIESFSGNAI